MDQINKVAVIANHYGWQNQSTRCVQDFASLIQAISSYNLRTADNTDIEKSCDRFYTLAENIANAHIMLEQMIYLLDCKHEYTYFRRRRLDGDLDKINKDKKK